MFLQQPASEAVHAKLREILKTSDHNYYLREKVQMYTRINGTSTTSGTTLKN